MEKQKEPKWVFDEKTKREVLKEVNKIFQEVLKK